MKKLLSIPSLRRDRFSIVNSIILSCAVLLGSFAFKPGVSKAEEIKQPIDFSHKTHVNDNMIPCEFCHIYASRSDVAGIPPVQTCVSCHMVIKGRDERQQSEIDKILTYWGTETPIPWKKIHDLPDFVYFSHKRHIKAGFGCFDCHGNVNMSQTPVLFGKFDQTPLSMGWCLECHKLEHEILKPGKNTDGILRGINADGNQDAVLAKEIIQGSKDCLVCHK
ncbi:MAG: cytochrome c family protein [Deltaproteobacteria bacterium]|nr:cytochrome c family protein [Deltaproteobacteria bacterium]